MYAILASFASILPRAGCGMVTNLLRIGNESLIPDVQMR
jgi:hypothetical protein